jgi:protein SCO1/2
MEKKFLWIGTGILLLVVVAAAVTIIVQRMTQSYNGSVISPPSPAPDFSLTSQTGQVMRLSDYRGKYVLLYFGYTNCTNECPATMAIMMKARLELGSQADRVQVVFVSTDPARDTPQAIGEFINRFDSSFVGATGSQAVLLSVWSAYGVSVENGGETHSSYIYLIDPTGNLRLTYPYSTTAEQLSADLQLLLRKN